MKVCIRKDENGKFFVSTEQQPDGEAMMQGETQAQETAETANEVPARDLGEALQIAGKVLSAPDPTQQSPFDQGVASTMSKM